MLKIDELSQNWSFERIAKPERTALMLGIAELKMKLTPRKVVISEWVKLVDKNSSSDGAKFVNAILDNYECCLLYTSDAADDLFRVDLGGRRIIKKKFF